MFSLIRGFFRSRQVYVRSRTDVHYVNFTPAAQIALVGMAFAALFWTAFASVNLLFKDQLLELKQQKMFEARLDYEHQLADMRASLESESDKLLLNQQSYLKKVDEVRAQFETLAGQQRRMREYFSKGWIPLQPVDTTEPAGSTAPVAPEVEGSLAVPFTQRFAGDFKSDGEVTKPLAEIDEALQGLHGQHVDMLKHGLAYAQSKVARTAALMQRVNVAVPSVSQQSDTGGPFVPVDGQPSSLAESEFYTGLSDIDTALRHNDELIAAVERFPLGIPLTEVDHISSSYGVRSDPLRHSLALHGGIDFVASYGTPVHTTSSGTVTWAGPHGPYGNLVEIQHDNGVATRYGHLKGVNVSLGQSVAMGDVIGWLGNTGRSTGPHLHYETRVDGHALDPQNFWRIRNDIQALKDNDNKQQ